MWCCGRNAMQTQAQLMTQPASSWSWPWPHLGPVGWACFLLPHRGWLQHGLSVIQPGSQPSSGGILQPRFAMVFSLLSARTLTSSCFLALTERRWPMNLPATPRSPQAKAAISRPKTTGAAMIMDRRPTPLMPIPILAEISVVSTASTSLTPRQYFLYS